MLHLTAANGAHYISGSLCYLSEYDRESRLYNLPMQLACDWINRLYRSSTTPVVMARSLGLYAINMLTPLRVLTPFPVYHVLNVSDRV